MNHSNISIDIQQLTKIFGERTAVNGLSLSIQQGEIFALLGENGAGKTTTIKMLCGLLLPTSGTATIMGFDIRSQAENIKKIIGVSPQETAIAAHLNSKENLMLMGGVCGLSHNECLTRAKSLMSFLEIEDRKDQARKLSGGLQRRLSIAMALMSDPLILFLDEPTLGLDPHARKSVWNYIEKLKRNKTILLTTHYLEEADTLSDTIAIMSKGNIIEKGTSHEIKNRNYKNQHLKIIGKTITDEIIQKISTPFNKVILIPNGFEIESQTIDLYGIIDILKENQVTIQKIEMKEPTLEEVFINLTDKEVKL